MVAYRILYAHLSGPQRASVDIAFPGDGFRRADAADIRARPGGLEEGIHYS